ncbi:hypothetical protein ACFLQY_02045 [Verrucomicrobiota bacterium]
MKLVEFPFGKFEFHEKYIVSEIAEGAQVECEDIALLVDRINEHYLGKPVGYISRRINESSMNPMVYIKHPPYEAAGIVSFAIVAYRDVSGRCARLEKQMSASSGQVQMELFWNFDAAVGWTLDQVERVRSGNAV